MTFDTMRTDYQSIGNKKEVSDPKQKFRYASFKTRTKVAGICTCILLVIFGGGFHYESITVNLTSSILRFFQMTMILLQKVLLKMMDVPLLSTCGMMKITAIP